MNKISLIGFGKIGQAVAVNILRNNIKVTAIDINPDLKKIFEEQRFEINEPGLKEILVPAFENGNLEISTDFKNIEGSEAVIIAIPLLVNQQKEIYHEPFLACFRNLAPHFSNKMLVIVETSIPVGYGRNTIVKEIEATGKKHGEDFLLVHSPERIKSGIMLEQLEYMPKVIGGVSEEAEEKAYQVYLQIFDKKLIHKVNGIEAAEFVKLAGMVYRDINIALSNQLAQFANQHHINYIDLLPLINSDREANLLLPGIGVGGHCTPVYPYFLIDNFKNSGLDFVLAKESRTINDEMANYAIQLIDQKTKIKSALILGLSFRPNVKEDTFSTSYLLNQKLQQKGYSTHLHDTEFSIDEIKNKGFEPLENIYETTDETIFLVTPHIQYKNLDFTKLAAQGVKYFVDGRNAFERKTVEASGIEYFGIGK